MSKINENIEIVFAQMIHENTVTVIRNCYKPPNSPDIDAFISYLTEKLLALQINTRDCIFSWDFNLSLLHIESDRRVSKFHDALNSLTLLPTNMALN